LPRGGNTLIYRRPIACSLLIMVRNSLQSLWAVLCEMLSITEATWAEEIPGVLLGLRFQHREDTGLSPAEAFYGVPTVLPSVFLQVKKFSLDQITNNFL
jgi:hypothetical protein